MHCVGRTMITEWNDACIDFFTMTINELFLSNGKLFHITIRVWSGNFFWVTWFLDFSEIHEFQ